MRNEVEEEEALVNFERNPLFLLLSVLVSAAIVYAAWELLKIYNPWGFIVAIPGAILSFQTLWLLLNPFAKIFNDRLEIKQTFLHRKTRYFVDIKKVSQKPGTRLFITFNDDEVERLNLAGIKSSDAPLLKEELGKRVSQSLVARP